MQPNPIFSTGETVLLACWFFVIAVLVFCADHTIAGGPPCAVEPSPRVAHEPLRDLRTKVTIDGGRGGRLLLVDELGERSATDILPGPRTTWVEWHDLMLEAGEYDVVLLSPGCTARRAIEVE